MNKLEYEITRKKLIEKYGLDQHFLIDIYKILKDYPIDLECFIEILDDMKSGGM